MSPNSTLVKEELERYSRQILLYGKQQQLVLKNKTVVVLGAGGIGSSLLLYLASSGVGHIHLFEFDTIEASNLGRQILYSKEDIGRNKGEVATQKLLALNPHIKITLHVKAFQKHDILPCCDLILEGTDSIESKFDVNYMSIQKKIPALIGGIGTIQGHIFPILSYKAEFACYSCIFRSIPQNLPTCSETGVLSSLPGIIGNMMAHLALLYFLEGHLESKLYLIHKFQWRNMTLKKNIDCGHLDNFIKA